ncbi:hypothetical protein DFH07DRAFT_964292 [Mycena maculata]|uniref:Uncharacterized protein n=1 Tax=Mycena maculata TaxID=230809 RepID=A0AAD7IHA0_9AGAR|nr:hypothetical protein DFH07DRAFT_964292 [Mycena maculata]
MSSFLALFSVLSYIEPVRLSNLQIYAPVNSDILYVQIMCFLEEFYTGASFSVSVYPSLFLIVDIPSQTPSSVYQLSRFAARRRESRKRVIHSIVAAQHSGRSENY